MVIARWASAHFSQVSLPRTAVRWTTALSSGYSSPILSTWSYAVTRHPQGPTSITWKQIKHCTRYIRGYFVILTVSHAVNAQYKCILRVLLQKSPTKGFLWNTRHFGSLLLPSSVVVGGQHIHCHLHTSSRNEVVRGKKLGLDSTSFITKSVTPTETGEPVAVPWTCWYRELRRAKKWHSGKIRARWWFHPLLVKCTQLGKCRLEGAVGQPGWQGPWEPWQKGKQHQRKLRFRHH